MGNEKQQQPGLAGTQSPQEKEPYVAPTIEVIEVQTERGYAGSLEPMPGHGW